jgi:hypothetical protein
VAKKLQQLENLPVVQFFSSASSSSLPRKDHNFLDEVNRRVWDIKQASNLKPNSCPNVFDSVADPNPNPPDPHVFWAWIRIRIHQSELWIRIRKLILVSPSKKSRKNHW